MNLSLNVVIVDDEPKIRRGITRLVEDHSSCWNVIAVFSNGKEALDFFRTTDEAIDLLITDVKMPEMDGLTLITKAKAFKSFQSLVISGYDDFVYVRSAWKEGVLDYVIKPIDRQMFKHQLSEIKNKIENRLYQKQVETLKRLFAGDLKIISEINHDDDFQGDTFRLCCISLDDPPHRMKSYTEKSWELLYYSVQNIVDEWISNQTNDPMSRGWSWQENKGHTWILLSHVEEVERLAEQIRVSITKYLGMTVTIAIGAEFNDLSYLAEFRNEVLTLLYFRLISGGNNVYMKENMLSSSSLDITSRLYQIGERIRVAMMQEDEKKTHALLNECIDELKEIQEPMALEQAVQYCLLQMMNVLSEIDHQKAKTWLTKELNDLYIHLSSFPSLQKRLTDLFLHIYSYIRTKRDKNETFSS